ncbi:hypothetical protein L873DRAFT_1697234, partial [Choiromyces venosus 120613-1]
DTSPNVNNLGLALKKHHEAEVMYRRPLMGAERLLGSDSGDTLGCIYNVAGALHKQREYDEVRRLHLPALAGREKTLGLDHRHTVQSTIELDPMMYDMR